MSEANDTVYLLASRTTEYLIVLPGDYAMALTGAESPLAAACVLSKQSAYTEDGQKLGDLCDSDLAVDWHGSCHVIRRKEAEHLAANLGVTPEECVPVDEANWRRSQ